MNTLQGRVALVTGSSRGIGAAIAVAFHPARAPVAVHGRDKDAVITAGRHPGGRMAAQHRRQPPGHVPDPEELPAWHEGPRSWCHRHHGFLGGPPARWPRADP